MEYETAHNQALRNLYEESDAEVEAMLNEQAYLIAKLEEIELNLKKELEPYKVSMSREEKLFKLIFGKNEKLELDPPPKPLIPG